MTPRTRRRLRGLSDLEKSAREGRICSSRTTSAAQAIEAPIVRQKDSYMHSESRGLMRRAWRAVLGASVAFAVSCTGDIAEPQGAGTQAAVHTHDDGSMVAALSLGATGPEVAELQD